VRNMNNHVSIAVIYCMLATLSLIEIGQDGSKENKSKDKAFAKGSTRHRQLEMKRRHWDPERGAYLPTIMQGGAEEGEAGSADLSSVLFQRQLGLQCS
jgi:hypothetical protein